MDPNLFLIAKVKPSSLLDDISWILSEGPPYERIDPIDFETTKAFSDVFDLYKQVYSQLGPLNVRNREQLIDFNRWVLIVDEKNIIGFAIMNTTSSGLKVCLVGTDESEVARVALKALCINGLNKEGVYAEISDRLEHSIVGHVPEVPLALAEQILEKPITYDADGRHYRRQITNVGNRKKILVGKPIFSEQV